ncbi:MAG TPA: YtxH domain-containing protein [Gemmatimonadales bacterium]|jgi:gas vesicle protein|nr:YtxH domain-containing protein [Gemmatimonadales bacterium]
MPRKKPTEVVFVERNDSSAKWLFWGAILGAGLALLYAPRSGEETRRSLQRRLRHLRAATEERMDELMERFAPGQRAHEADELVDDELDGLAEATSPPPPVRAPELSPREEIERRLAEARSRRRRETTPAVPEEPTA